MHWQCSRRKEEEEAVKRQVPVLLARGDWGCSVAKPYLTLCDCVDCSTPGYPVLHYLLEFAQIHVWGMLIINSSIQSRCIQSSNEGSTVKGLLLER